MGCNTFGLELYSRPEYLDAPSAYYIFPHWSAATRAGTSHNDYLQVLVDFGLLGFGLFIYLLFSIIKRSYINFKVAEDQFLKNSSLALFISLVSISAAFMVTSILYPVGNLLGVFFWYNIGLIIAIKKIVSGSSPAPNGTTLVGNG
jgi:O-antigen ligase